MSRVAESGPIKYGSAKWVRYQERKRQERQKRGMVGRTAASSYYTTADEVKRKLKKKKRKA